MTGVSVLGAFVAGLVSFLSPCVFPLVPGYVSMLSGIGMEQPRQGGRLHSGLVGSSLAFVAGFSAVFVAFGASASAVGQFLRQNRASLAPVAGALILLFGLHLLGWLGKLSHRAGLGVGLVLASLGLWGAIMRSGSTLGGFRPMHFLSLIGFLGPTMARWLNRDLHLRNQNTRPGIGSGFLLGFALAFGWTPCIGPILATVLALATGEDTVARGVLLLAVYAAGLAIPFLLTALGIGQFLRFTGDSGGTCALSRYSAVHSWCLLGA